MSKGFIGGLCLFLGLGIGGIIGFFAGVFSTEAGQKFFANMSATEEVADIGQSKLIKRKFFSVEYPGNWQEDKSFDYDAENWLYVASPGSSYVTFTIYEMETDTAANVAEQVEVAKEDIKDMTQSNFSQWGGYKGHGTELKGRMMGLNRGTVRIFSHTTAKYSFVVVEQHYNEDESMTAPGFDLIQKTFKLKN